MRKAAMLETAGLIPVETCLFGHWSLFGTWNLELGTWNVELGTLSSGLELVVFRMRLGDTP
jgi:hypothetical protein